MAQIPDNDFPDYLFKALAFLESQAAKFNELAERIEIFLKEIEKNHGTNS